MLENHDKTAQLWSMSRPKGERGLGFGFLQNDGISLAKGKHMKIIQLKSKQQQCLENKLRACLAILFPVAIVFFRKNGFSKKSSSQALKAGSKLVKQPSVHA